MHSATDSAFRIPWKNLCKFSENNLSVPHYSFIIRSSFDLHLLPRTTWPTSVCFREGRLIIEKFNSVSPLIFKNVSFGAEISTMSLFTQFTVKLTSLGPDIFKIPNLQASKWLRNRLTRLGHTAEKSKHSVLERIADGHQQNSRCKFVNLGNSSLLSLRSIKTTLDVPFTIRWSTWWDAA